MSTFFLINMLKELRLNKLAKPIEQDVEARLRWIFSSLGIKTGRDLNETSIKIFKEILLCNFQGKAVRTEKLREKLHLTVAAINYHLRALEDLGLIERHKRQILLREKTLARTLEELKKDVDRILLELIEEAEKLDKELFNMF